MESQIAAIHYILHNLAILATLVTATVVLEEEPARVILVTKVEKAVHLVRKVQTLAAMVDQVDVQFTKPMETTIV